MKDHISSLLVYALCVLARANFFVGGYRNRSCIESEKQALLVLKISLYDYSNYMLTWVGDDCCAWRGITCNNRSGQVMRINLSHSSFRFGETRIPGFFENFTSLSELDLSHNNFQGFIPQSIGKLTSLSYLDLSSNNFEGLIPQSIGNLTSLTHLDLSSNRLDGLIPQTIGNLTSLSTLDLSQNRLNGFLSEALCQLSNVEKLDVSHNKLTGSIPKCIGELSNLKYLDLFSNSWEGFVSEHHFVKLNKLTYLSISSESKLVFNVSSKWIPPFQLQSLYIDSVKVGPQFPQWLFTQRQIMYVRMPNTGISDIPADRFESVLSQAMLVDLSNNDISTEQLSLTVAIPNVLGELVLSNNGFSGEFPAFLCNLTSLFALFLSNNNYSGELPRCLGNLTKLRDFDVMNNKFSGDIPDSFGSLGSLTYLNLHNNNFRGKLPLSLQNLTQLVTLDVGKNNLSDILPRWTGEQLPGLRYLILRSNNFYGTIPTQICSHSSIQELNLAGNQITGNIPPCFGNFTAMVTGDNSDSGFIAFNGETILDNVKGNELNFTTNLKFIFSIDLSNNNISGEIPEELMDLHSLLNLNLAGNHLTGRIPDRFGRLKELEFLDLSRNEFYGPIPQSLSDSNYLLHLNLSFNDLSGKIPTGKLLDLFQDLSIYAGNNQLCGRPFWKPCPIDTDVHNNHDHKEADSASDSDDEHIWFCYGIGSGLLVGFLGFCASLHFIKSWRYSYFHFVQHVFDKIAVSIALWRKKFYN